MATADKVTLGIRPEALNLLPEGASLPLRVDVAELTGPELIVTGSIGTQRLVASFPARQRIAPGSTLALRLPADQAHFFDVDSGRRLNDDNSG